MAQTHAARRFPALPGRAAWNALLPERFEAPPLSGSESCDVAIIGAGFAGLAAARRLRQGDPNLKIAILDALPIGEGGIGRNSGFMIDLPHDLTSEDYSGEGEGADKVVTRLNRRAIEFVAEAVSEFGIDQNHFQRLGKINGAVSDKGDRANRNYARHLQHLGETYRFLEAEDMRRITGSPLYRCGLYTPGTVLLQPAGYASGMVRGLTRNNAIRAYPDTRVLGFSKQRGGWSIVTDAGRVDAGRIVLATNGHLDSFGFSRGRLMHVFLHAAVTEAMGPNEEKRLGGEPLWGVTPADPAGTTMRRIVDSAGYTRIVTRTGISFRQDMTVPPHERRRTARMMQKKFDARFPDLAGFPTAYSWSGELCLSYNGASVAREVDNGVFAACVQNGLGSTRGTLTGIAVAEQILGETSEISDFFVKGAELPRLPPEPIATLGGWATTRYREWQAGPE